MSYETFLIIWPIIIFSWLLFLKLMHIEFLFYL